MRINAGTVENTTEINGYIGAIIHSDKQLC